MMEGSDPLSSVEKLSELAVKGSVDGAITQLNKVFGKDLAQSR